jgi:hypothetical protein
MGAIEFHGYFRSEGRPDSQTDVVAELALKLKELLEQKDLQREIEQAHIFGASSHKIQEAITPSVLTLGFTSEKKGLFADIKVPGIRPDFYKPIKSGGIILEVERGKTIANNMDLLDVWKTHICQSANHLFLLVPQIRVTQTGAKQKIYSTVVNRVGAFFEENTDPIDIDSVHIFGY